MGFAMNDYPSTSVNTETDERKPVGVKFEKGEGPKLTEHTLSHVETLGWEDGLPPSNMEMTIPHRDGSVGAILPSLDKVGGVVPRGTLEAGFYKQAGVMKNLGMAGALTGILAGAPGKALGADLAQAVKKSRPAVERALKSTEAYQGARSKGNIALKKLLDKTRSSSHSSSSPVTSTLGVTGAAQNGSLSPESSSLKLKLKNLSQLRAEKGNLSSYISRKGTVGANYKNVGASYNPKKGVSISYQATPNVDVKGFHGPQGSGGSVGAKWNF